MLAFSGFNGFGQFGSENGNRTSKAKVFSIDPSANQMTELIAAVAWSYAAFATGNKLWLKGFLLAGPNKSLMVTTAAPVKQLAACDKFCLVLLESGQLFKILPKSDCTLQPEFKIAHVDEEMDSSRLPTKRGIFGEIRSHPKIFKLLHIACGENIACAVSNTNAVYNLPSKIHQLAKHIRVEQLVCGFEHALLLTSNGDVYAWGNGLRGQLGQDIVEMMEQPTLIEALAGIKITNISASGWHSAAVSAFGDIYTWGFNSNGQLGLPVFNNISGLKNPAVYALPQIINLPQCCTQRKIKEAEAEACEFLEDCVPLKVFTGARHTVLQMSCGSLFACGWNAHGQLGLDSCKQLHDKFEIIKLDLESENFSDDRVDVICGAWNTIFKKLQKC